MANELQQGQVRPGIIVDGQEGTPYVVGVLTYEDGHGPLLQVPYAPHVDQFSSAEAWFRERDPLP